MENIEFKAHVNDVISLLRTLVVKCELIALQDNQLLNESGYAVSSDKTTWRYYLNMNGLYHPTDDIMTVRSLDTGEDIVFNKENLTEHLATLRAYQPGDYWYTRLTETYPHQIDLINGILDPIDLAFAISSQDYKILRYNKKLIASNETQLIPKIQEFTNQLMRTLINNNEYIYTENLMLPTVLATLYGYLVPVTLIARLEAYGTRYVGDYHTWAKLNSHGNFEGYRATLNHEQQMWLYRNIEWIRNTTGQQLTFDGIVENLMTPAQIALTHYQSVLSTEHLLTDGTATPGYRKTPINFKESTASSSSITSVSELMNKSLTQARDNAKEQVYLESEIDEALRYSIHSEQSTKVVESAMEDYSNRHTDTLMKCLMHEWVYLLKHNRYNAIIDLTNPVTGEAIRVDVRDGLLLWQYLTRRARGESTEYIEPFYYQQVMTITPRPLKDFTDAGGVEYLPEWLCKDIRNLWIASPRIISPETFFDFCLDVYGIQWKAKKVYSKYMDIYKHARTKEATNRLFERGCVFLHNREYDTYEAYLNEKELNFDLLSNEDCLLLAWDIFQLSTAWSTKATASLRKIQSNLIDLMRNLTSYTIDYIADMDDGNRTIERNQRRGMSFNPDLKMSNDDALVGRLLFPHDTNGYMRFKSKATIDALNIVPMPEPIKGVMEGRVTYYNQRTMKPKATDLNYTSLALMQTFRTMTEHKP